MPAMTIVFALFGSLFIGASDFLGGIGAHRRSGLAVTATAQVAALVVLLPVALVMGTGGIQGREIGLGLLTGVATGLAYAAFFTALARGRMSIVVPVSALTTAGIPALIGIATGDGLAALGWIGLGCALVAVPLVTVHEDASLGDEGSLPGPPHHPRWPVSRQVIVALASGLGFCWFYVAIGNTETTAGLWPTVANIAAAAAVTAVLTLGREGGGALTHPTRFMIGSGLTMAVADIGLTRALQLGPLEVAAVLGNLYPVVTVLLAVWFLHERLHPANVAGIALAIGGVTLLALA